MTAVKSNAIKENVNKQCCWIWGNKCQRYKIDWQDRHGSKKQHRQHQEENCIGNNEAMRAASCGPREFKQNSQIEWFRNQSVCQPWSKQSVQCNRAEGYTLTQDNQCIAWRCLTNTAEEKRIHIRSTCIDVLLTCMSNCVNCTRSHGISEHELDGIIL